MSDVGTVRGQLVLDDKFTPVLTHASATIMGFGQQLSNMGRGVASIAGNFNYLKGSIAGLGIRRLVEEVVQAQQATDRMRASLLVATGSFKGVGDELSFVRKEANRLGLDFASVAQGYGQFAAASKGTGIASETLRATFVAVSEAATVLGLSSDKTAGALNAIQQMMTKGTVQAEELRGQLGDRIPGAVQMMARALKVSTAELNKMLEAGKVITKDILPAFAEEMHNVYSSGVEAASRSLTAEINRTKTALFDLFAGVADSTDIIDLAKHVRTLVDSLAGLVNSKLVVAMLNDVGTAASGALGIVAELFNVLELISNLGGKEENGGFLGTGLKLSDMSFLSIWSSTLEFLNKDIDALKAKFKVWWAEVQKDAIAAGRNVMSVGSALRGMASGDMGDASRNQFVGPIITPEQRAAANAQIAKENTALINKMVKDFKELDRTMGDAFDLKDKLEDQKMELKAFDAVLKATGGDFTKAKRYADSYLAVLKAGLDPTKGLGKELYEMAKAIDDQRIAFDEAEEKQKEYLKGVEHMDGLMDKFAEKERKRDEAKRKAAAAMAARVEKSLTNLQDQVDAEMAMIAAQDAGADAMREAAREAKILDAIQSNLPDGIKIGTDAYWAFADSVRAILEPLLLLQDEQTKFNESIQGWKDAGSIIGEFDSKLGAAVSAAADMAAAVRDIGTAVKGTSKSFEAWAGAITSGVEILKSAGLVAGPGGGESNFGGNMSGTYSGEGAVVGAIIGAVIGSMVGATAAGAAAGSAIGEVIGSMINKGADEGLIMLQNKTSEFGERFGVVLTGMNNKLGRMMQRVGTEIVDGVNDLVTTLGGEIAGIEQLDMKVRENEVIVFVNGIRRVFKEMADAVSFAMKELLRSAEYVNLDPLFEAVLRGNNADNMEQLKSDLEAIQKVINFGFTDSQIAVRQFTNELDVYRNTVVRSVQSTEQLARGLANLGMEEVKRFQSARDAITGDQKSNAEKLELLRADARMWNAEKALRIAELQAKKEFLTVQNELTQAEIQIRATGTDAEVQWLQNRSDLLGAEASMFNAFAGAQIGAVNASLTLLQVQINAIDQLIAALEAMPDIDIPSLRLPNVGGGHGGGGGNVNTGPSEEDQLIEGFNQFLRGQMLNNLTDLQRQLEELDAAYEAQLEAARLVEGGEAALAAQREEDLIQIRKELVDGLGLPLEGVRDRLSALKETLAFLASEVERTGQGANRLAQIMGELTVQASIELGGLAAEIADAFGMDKEAAAFRAKVAELELRLKIIQLQLLYKEYEALGLIDAALKALFDGFFDYILDPANWPSFDLPEEQTETQTNPQDEGNPLLDALMSALDRLRNAVEGLTQSNLDLLMSDVSPLTLQQQFEEAQRRYNEVLAAAQGGDLGAIEEFADVRDEYLALAAAMFGTAGAGYGEIFAGAHQAGVDLAAAGQAILDAMPAQMEGTEIRLDTIASILRAMAVVWGVNVPWNPVTGGSEGLTSAAFAAPTMDGAMSRVSSVSGNLINGNFGAQNNSEVVGELRKANEGLRDVASGQMKAAGELRNLQMMRSVDKPKITTRRPR